MKRLILGLIGVLLASAASAANVQVLPGGCGTAVPSGGSNLVYVDSTGKLCTDASGGGGGGTVTQGPAGSAGTAWYVQPGTGAVFVINQTQVNGVTLSTGAGAVGTGSQRMAVGQDTTTIAGSAPGTAQVPSANVITTTTPVSNFASGTATVTGTSSTQVIAAVASNRLYATSYSCSNTGATAVDINFQDGSGGTSLWHVSCPAGGGANVGSARPMFRTTSGNALFFAASAASTSVIVSVGGFSGS